MRNQKNISPSNYLYSAFNRLSQYVKAGIRGSGSLSLCIQISILRNLATFAVALEKKIKKDRANDLNKLCNLGKRTSEKLKE